MKKLRILLSIALITTLASACHFGKHTTIIETGNNYRLKIEYKGRIYFNEDGTAISSISHGGYVKYERNDQKLEAHNDGHGGVRYELSDHGDPVSAQDQKGFIAHAVSIMLQKNHRPNWNYGY